MHRLAPWATHLTTGGSTRVDCTDLAVRIRQTHRHDPTIPGMLGRAMEGFPVGVHELVADCGVVSAVFSARRPFHPRRLRDALNALPDGVLRGRGQMWIANRPETVIGYEYAGGSTGLDDLGYWLAALPEHRWTEATANRRMTADLDWDPYYGDRRTTLAFIGLDIDPAAVIELLNGCLLTHAEVAAGEDAWHTYSDPFAGYLRG
jgi:G3E family GTPase